jgi:hypothetical protein
MSKFQDYYVKNKDKILQRLSQYQKNRYKNDIEFKLRKRIEARIKQELPEYDGTIEELLGCNISFLRKWLKFCGGTKIDWDNIHLHHVRPINTYSKNIKHYSYHWSNINLLPASENLSIKDTRNTNSEEIQRKLVLKFLLSTDITSLP